MADGGWQVGARVPMDRDADARSICASGAHRWHALIVPAMGEGAAEAWLSRLGVYAFHPVRTVTRLHRGRRVRVESRYLPGYVFARFRGAPVWHRIFARRLVVDVLRLHSGTPGLIRPGDLDALHAMRSVERMAEDDARRAAIADRKSRSLRRGDRVRIVDGAFADFEAEVVEIGRGKVRFSIELFGRPVEADMSPGAVERI